MRGTPQTNVQNCSLAERVAIMEIGKPLRTITEVPNKPPLTVPQPKEPEKPKEPTAPEKAPKEPELVPV